MDDLTNTQNKDSEPASPDVPQSGDMTVAPEVLSQPTAEVPLQPTVEPMDSEPTVQNVEPPQPKSKRKRWLVALAAVLTLGVVGGAAWFVSGSGEEPGELADKSGTGEDGISDKVIDIVNTG